MKPGHVALHEHRALAAAGDGGTGELDRLGPAVRARDHLDQRHQQRRVPVVRADGALGRAAGLADLADRERRGVAGDHGVGEVRGDRREHLALERRGPRAPTRRPGRSARPRPGRLRR